MLELVAGMSLVARPTGSTAHFLVHVQEVKILVAIAKVCQAIGSDRLNERLFMTAKTQLIIHDIE